MPGSFSFELSRIWGDQEVILCWIGCKRCLSKLLDENEQSKNASQHVFSWRLSLCFMNDDEMTVDVDDKKYERMEDG